MHLWRALLQAGSRESSKRNLLLVCGVHSCPWTVRVCLGGSEIRSYPRAHTPTPRLDLYHLNMSNIFKKLPCCSSSWFLILSLSVIFGSQKTHLTHRKTSQKSNVSRTEWKAPQEKSRPCGLAFSGTVRLVPRETDSDSRLYSQNWKALSLPRSLLNAAPQSERSDTGRFSVSPSVLYSRSEISSRCWSGVRVRRGRWRESLEGGQRSHFDAGCRPASGRGLMRQTRCEEDVRW